MVGTLTFNSKTKFSYRYIDIFAYDSENYSQIENDMPSVEYTVDIFTGFIDTKRNGCKISGHLLSSDDITELYIGARRKFIKNPLYPKFMFKKQSDKFEIKPIKTAKTKNPSICAGNMFLNKGLYIKTLEENKTPLELSLICDALNHAFGMITNTSVRLYYPAPCSIYVDITPYTARKFNKALLPYIAKCGVVDEYQIIKDRYMLDTSEVPSKFIAANIKEFEITNSVDFVARACDEYRLMKYLVSKYVVRAIGGKKVDANSLQYLFDLPSDTMVQKYVLDCKVAFGEVLQNLHSFGYFDSKQTMEYAFARELLVICNENSKFDALADTIYARKYSCTNTEFPKFKICDKYFDNAKKKFLADIDLM